MILSSLTLFGVSIVNINFFSIWLVCSSDIDSKTLKYWLIEENNLQNAPLICLRDKHCSSVANEALHPAAADLSHFC
jgi:hypothetical protein